MTDKTHILINSVRENKTKLIDDYFDPVILYAEIKEVLSRITSETYNPNIRTYINCGVRDDLSTKIKKSSFNTSEEINFWISTLLNSKDYCFVINQIERWNIPITEFFKKTIIEPWTANLGTQLLGFEIFSFIGKYEQTPFGIHDDQDHTILLNLGPNTIEAWVWEKDIYKTICNISDITFGNFDIDKIQEYGKKIFFEPGDLLFIPKGEYHTFRRKEFSVTLGLIPIPFLPRKIIEKFIFANLNQAIFNRHREVDYIDNTNLQIFIGEYAQLLNEEIKKIDILEQFELNQLTLKSNGFLANTYLRNGNSEYSSSLSARNQIEWKNIKDERMIIFINGFEVIVPKKNSIIKTIDILNLQEKVEYSFLVSLLKKDMSDESANKLVDIFKNFLF